MKPKQPDWDELAAHNAGKENSDIQECFFCMAPFHVDDLAGAPEGSSQTIRDMYLERPRCMSCDLDIRMRLNAAMIKGIESVFGSIPKTVERSEDEKRYLDEVFSEQNREALTELDVDRLAQEHGDGRFYL